MKKLIQKSSKLRVTRFKKTAKTPSLKTAPKEPRDYFPTFSRIIPVVFFFFTKWNLKKIVYFLICVLLFGAVVFMSIGLYKTVREKQLQDRQREKIISEIDFWKKITNTYKNYRDAYFKIALLEYQLNNKARALEYLQKALDLDPNFEEGRRLEKLLK